MSDTATPHRIVVLSDVHQDLAGLRALGATLAAADLVVLAGDLTRSGGRVSARGVIDAIRDHTPRVLAIHGNCDRREALEFLEEEGISLHGKAVRLGDLAIFGVGGSNPTPLRTPSEYTERELGDFLERAASSTAGARVRMAVVHAPPRNTPLDRMFLGFHVGSRAFRRFIENDRPTVAVSGHIHESRAIAQVGRTLCVNPGGFVGHWRYAEVLVEGLRVQARLCQAANPPGRLRRSTQLVRKFLSR